MPVEPCEPDDDDTTVPADRAVPNDRAVPTDRAVVDRIVDGVTAVLLVGPDEELLEIAAAELPDGAGDGTWLVLDMATTPPTVLEIDQDLTEARRSDAEARLAELRRTRSSGRFD